MNIFDMGDGAINLQTPGLSRCSSPLTSVGNGNDVDDVIELHAHGILSDENPSLTKHEVDNSCIGLTVREEVEVQNIILKAERECYNDLGKSYNTPISKEEELVDANSTSEMSGLLVNKHREDSSDPQSAELHSDRKQDKGAQNAEIRKRIQEEFKQDSKITKEIHIDAEIKQKTNRNCEGSETVSKIDRAAMLSEEDKAIMLDLVDIALGEKKTSEASVLANASVNNQKKRQDLIKRFINTHFKTIEVNDLQHKSHRNDEKDYSIRQSKFSKTATPKLSENVQKNTTDKNNISTIQLDAVTNPPPTTPEEVLTPDLEEDESGYHIGLSLAEEEEVNEIIKSAERVYKGKVDTTKDRFKVEDESKCIKYSMKNDTIDTADYEELYHPSRNSKGVFNNRDSCSEIRYGSRSRRIAKEYERVRKPDLKKLRSEEFSFNVTSRSSVVHRESKSSDRSKRSNQRYSPDCKSSLNLKNTLESLNLKDILKLQDSAVIVINNFEMTQGSSRRRRHSTSSSSPSPRERSTSQQKQVGDTPRPPPNVFRRPARWENVDDIKPFVPRNLYQYHGEMSPRHPQNAVRSHHPKLVASRPHRCRCKLSFPHPSIHPWRTELGSSKHTSSDTSRTPAACTTITGRALCSYGDLAKYKG